MTECGNEYCEEKDIHKYNGFHYCNECIHEHVYDECDPDPCGAKTEIVKQFAEKQGFKVHEVKM